MIIKELLRGIWQIILGYRCAKKQFFHGNENLENLKEYGNLFRNCISAGIKLRFYDTEKKIFYLTLPSGITVKSDHYYIIFLEIFVWQYYTLPPLRNSKFYVFDVGMNRGYTSLYYASDPDCEKTWGFEINSDTYRWAQENFMLNPQVASKIQGFNFGLLDEDKELNVFYVEGEDGVSTMDESFVDAYWSEERKRKKQQRKEYVKKVSIVFQNLFDECDQNYLKILKIDCEGAEYKIFKDLNENNMVNEFDVIVGECHYGMEGLEKYLGNFNCVSKIGESKQVMQFCYLNKKTFDL